MDCVYNYLVFSKEHLMRSAMTNLLSTSFTSRLARLGALTLSSLIVVVWTPSVSAQHAVQVIAYEQGTTAAPVFGSNPPAFFNTASAGLGAPSRTTGTGEFAGPVTPFNGPYLTDEIVSIGETGAITLRLSHYVLPQGGSAEIGVFTNVNLRNHDGIAGTPEEAFGIDWAEVSVSDDGVGWVSLGNTEFDMPTSGYRDVDQTLVADFQQPFSAQLSDFEGLHLSNPNGGADVLSLLHGSGGGKWLDISATGLDRVGYIRFSVADDSNAAINLNFELDAVSIASSAMGAATVPEPSGMLIVLVGGISLLAMRRRRRG